MSQGRDPAELVGCTADRSLLAAEGSQLPDAVGRPESTIPATRVRGRLVGVGAALTAISLLLGIALMLLGVIEFVSGGAGVLDVGALAVGAALAGTHWGWVHVAEATADSIEQRRNRDVLDRRSAWLEAIEPYTRHEVTTSVGEDGAISIVRVAYRPARSGTDGFTFRSEVTHREVHSGDEPSAVVVERAELLRRQAAADTQRERQRFEAAAGAYESSRLASSEDQQAQAVHRAASEALSERINSHLRDPPLTE